MKHITTLLLTLLVLGGCMLMPDGYAEMELGSGSTLAGEFINGKLNGKGTYTKTNGLSYSGDWVNDRWHGKGTLIYPNGDKYEGEFVGGFLYFTGKKQGRGTYTWANGDKYEGTWRNDSQLIGTEYKANGDIFKLREYFPETGKAYGDYLFKDGTSHNDALFINGEFVSANVRKPNGDYYKTEVKDGYVTVDTNVKESLETIGSILGGIINFGLGVALIAAELESGQSSSTNPVYKKVRDCKYSGTDSSGMPSSKGRYVCKYKKVRVN